MRHFMRDSGIKKTTASVVRLEKEAMEYFVKEALARMAALAKQEGSTVVEISHLSRVLPELLLDF